ncbi:hypothetical protein [uncultured Methanospirillum sp.]|uniref:hypothetical protein n=1 Tax=uncultured Methanospirillum sp. TaxID=262503 RepID=UPI0029C6109F|nr:hypothetical protein [uncultured Methanospirillum sp.]
MMIRTVALLTCIVMLFGAVIAEDTNSTTNSTSNLTNATNISQTLTNTTIAADNLTNSSSLTTEGGAPDMNGSNQATAQVAPAATQKPVYKQSVGSVYEADYQEPQPMTFTSYPTC